VNQTDDDPVTHDVGDDRGTAGQGADDPAGQGADDPAGHDATDDSGRGSSSSGRR
jgi:merozoite surface protein 4